jgi:type VI secretion system protein ImpG
VSDALLSYYMRELAYIRQQGSEFAERYPKVAGRLRLGRDRVDDPMVERLIEAVAFLNARIRHKLDDDFPEIAEAMLGALYPHYVRPVPSMSIVQCIADPTQGGLTGGYAIAPDTVVESEAIDGEQCRFRTCYPLTLWPIKIHEASLRRRPFEAPVTPTSRERAGWLLHIQLGCADGLTFAKLPIGSLRFFLMGKAQYVFDLYEGLFVNVIEVAASSPSAPAPLILGPDCLRPVGFEADEAVLPDSSRSFPGYRLLTEFFAFPSKFLFFDVTGAGTIVPEGAGTILDLYFYLDRLPPRLEPSYVTKDSFQLGCTPMINLFRKRAEPLRLSHAEAEVQVVPDVRRPMSHEVYSIDRVTSSSPSGEAIEYLPFYGVHAAEGRARREAFWHATRRPGAGLDPGTEVFLTLVDLDARPAPPVGRTLHVETTCLNRDLPSRLPFGGDRPHLQLGVSAPLAKVICLSAPSPTLRPPTGPGVLWPLISHLTLNHLSISDGQDGAEPLRAILRLYDFSGADDAADMIAGLLSVRSRRSVSRTGEGGETALARGLEVTAHFDEKKFTGNGLLVLASVLERFLGMYCSINSFSKLIVTTKQREGVLKQWKPRAGVKTIL